MTTDWMTWQDHQKWEQAWWGECTNTFAEETKQISYAHRMGLPVVPDPEGNERWPMYDLGGKTVVDIGGGPTSILLKCFNFQRAIVVDPCSYPGWTEDRYAGAGIEVVQRRGEDFTMGRFDEVWAYNVLQHVDNPRLIASNARLLAPVVRVFEWLDIPPCPGHPWQLGQARLDEWYDGTGVTEQMQGENACYGKAYYGTFGG